jgi:excisionase family DNA binding protein
MMSASDKDRSSHKVRTRFFTIGDVAHQLDVSARTVHRWVADRKLVVHRIARSVRVSEADLKAFLAIHRDED